MSQTGTTYNEAKTKLSTFFKPKVNVEYERAVFRHIRQLPNETIDAYHTRLRIAAGSYSFYSMDSEIKSHIIQTTKDTKLRKKGLLGALSLDEIIAESRNNELCDKQSRDMERELQSLQVSQINSTNASRDESVSFVKSKNGCCGCGRSYPNLLSSIQQELSRV